MSSGPRFSLNRPALTAVCLFYVCVALAVFCAGTAKASYYKLVLCAAGNGTPGPSIQTNTISPQNPAGIFVYQYQCGNSGYPAGNDTLIRLFENQGSGLAGYQAYASVSWSAPHAVTIAGGGGYTRQPNDFADGWRARFWGEGHDGSTNNFLMQGSGVANGSLGGIGWSRTTSFASHLWPFPSYGSYRRFVYEMTCSRQAGCDRSGFNATDANTFVLTLNDVEPSRVGFLDTGSGILSGAWVRGQQQVRWEVSDQGAGMRFDRLRVDGARRHEIDWRGSCNLGENGATGEFARDFRPCPTGGPWSRGYDLDTAAYADGSHTVQVCSQDYGQATGLDGTRGESCVQRSVRFDNKPPAAPGGLSIQTPNPARYLEHFGARWTLPSDPGSPIRKVHYDILDAAGKRVVAEKVFGGTNPTELKDISGPKEPGAYRLRVWLEDEVGFTGPAAVVPIPHDTTPPAAPQEVAVTSPRSTRAQEGFDVRWQNVTDNGAPIDSVHYEVLDRDGSVVVSSKTVGDDNPQSIGDLDTPGQSGAFTLRLWLSDAEGNVGAASEAPLAYDCLRSEVRGGTHLTTGLGEEAAAVQTVDQGEGSTLRGRLTNEAGNGVGRATLCVFSRVVTRGERDFLGLAVTGGDGNYRFPVAPGASREVAVGYRSGAREVTGNATLQTVVHPTFNAYRKVVRNKSRARFFGAIPGPDNNNVVVVLQVKRGKGWLAFRRYRTREGGLFTVPYKFNKTRVATKYLMRVQVRNQSGYPYLQGNSKKLTLIVLPKKGRRGAEDSKGRRQTAHRSRG